MKSQKCVHQKEYGQDSLNYLTHLSRNSFLLRIIDSKLMPPRAVQFYIDYTTKSKDQKETLIQIHFPRKFKQYKALKTRFSRELRQAKHKFELSLISNNNPKRFASYVRQTFASKTERTRLICDKEGKPLSVQKCNSIKQLLQLLLLTSHENAKNYFSQSGYHLFR